MVCVFVSGKRFIHKYVCCLKLVYVYACLTHMFFSGKCFIHKYVCRHNACMITLVLLASVILAY
jgi:hypothetical protein